MFDFFKKKKPSEIKKLGAEAISIPLPLDDTRIQSFDETSGDFYQTPIDFDYLSSQP